MLYKSIKFSINLLLILISYGFSFSSWAYLSSDVTKAMDQANLCRQATQELVFVECMRRNNTFIQQAIKRKSQSATAKFSSRTQKKVSAGIEKSIQSKVKTCMQEQTRFSNQSAGNRRHEYCLYENMLEVLINIDRNIERFAE
jgi:Flp pilus assembly protein TadG